LKKDVWEYDKKMPIEYRGELIPEARRQRRNMTPQERKLWFTFLRAYPIRFQRIKTIGSFIVDFYCAKARLAVEIDGAPHFSDQGNAYDDERTGLLKKYCIEVIRFTNNDIDYTFDKVCEIIDHKVNEKVKSKT
jgi:very-short-patch-repair endonuclease